MAPREPDFEYIALIALTLLAYAIVAAEALPELLALPFALGVAALIVTETHFELEALADRPQPLRAGVSLLRRAGLLARDPVAWDDSATPVRRSAR